MRKLLFIVGIIIASVFSIFAIIFLTDKVSAKENKQPKLERLGFEPLVARMIVEKCEKLAKNSGHCIQIVGMLGKNESSAGKNAKNNNIFGKRHGKFETKEKSVDWIVGNYVKYYHIPKKYNPDAFYSKTPKKPITLWCVDEVQKDGRKLNYCPNGNKISWHAYNYLK